jgi:hypothetical protein
VNDVIVLAHAGEEALPVFIPLVVIAVLIAIARRRGEGDRGEDEDSREPD